MFTPVFLQPSGGGKPNTGLGNTARRSLPGLACFTTVRLHLLTHLAATQRQCHLSVSRSETGDSAGFEKEGGGHEVRNAGSFYKMERKGGPSPLGFLQRNTVPPTT